MQVTDQEAGRGSEQEFADKFRVLSDAGAGVVQIRTQEVTRALLALRRTILLDGGLLHEWDVVNGYRSITVDRLYDLSAPGDSNPDIHSSFVLPGRDAADTGASRDGGYSYYVYVCPQPWLDGNPGLSHLIRVYAHTLPPTSIRVVLLTPDIPLPADIASVVHSIDFRAPSHKELKASLQSTLAGVDDENLVDISPSDLDKICFAGAGLPAHSFETYASLAIVQSVANSEENSPVTVDDILLGVTQGKTEVVRQNDLLELMPSSSLADIGGLENLKTWVRKRANCYSDEARAFGIEPPKGVVLVGIAGTGKSAGAKAIAGELGLPLVRLDFGRVFNSLVGSSEARIRTALKMVEDLSPVVLLIDEIDRGLGGAGGSGDGGTSSRVLGSFLTWTAENKKPVFSVLTCNSVVGLPPEVLRKGRFDQTFGVGLPHSGERREILSIHLRKRGWDISDFSEAEVQSVVAASNSYVGAEIESSVKDGLIDAFSEGEDFSLGHVTRALHNMVPMSRTYSERIQALSVWLKENAVPASAPEEEPERSGSSPKAARTRIRARKEN